MLKHFNLIFIVLTLLMSSFSFVIANETEVNFTDSSNFEEEFPEEEFFEDENFEFPEEMSVEDSEHPTFEPYIEKDTDDKGIYYEIHYDKYERAVRVEDHFIRDYKAVTAYEYFPKLQLRERDGLQGYEWVVSREEGTFYKGDEVIAVRNFDFDKEGDVISTEKEGITLVITIMRILSAFYGVDPPAEV